MPRAAAESKGILVRNAGVARKIGSRPTATISPWQVLGVDKRASQDEIKRAYKKLALEWHPDRHPEEDKAEAEAKFKSIVEAYETMTRPRKLKLGSQQLALVAPNHWRSQHREWISACRGARGVPPGRQAGHGGRGRPPGQLGGNGGDDGRVPCPHCGRRFGQTQAERHIPRCTSVKSRPKPPSRRPELCDAPGTGTSRPSSGPRPSSKVAAPGLAPGSSVCLQGLVAAPQLNGTEGVLDRFDPGSQRWHVTLVGGETKAFKPENLQQLPRGGMGGRASAGTARPPSRGPSQSANAPEAPHARRPSRPEAPSRQAPPGLGTGAAATALRAGDTVRLKSLMSSAHLNGAVGVLQAFDGDAQRWRVELPGGETKSVRHENLESMGPGRPAAVRPPATAAARQARASSGTRGPAGRSAA